MTNPEPIPLKWEFDQRGRWSAYSQIMDPDMTDEDPASWCHEWCLSWVIYVDESGHFCHDESDKLLFRECEVLKPPDATFNYGSLLRSYSKNLEKVQEKMQLIEQHMRTQEAFSNGAKIVLLPKEVYCR